MTLRKKLLLTGMLVGVSAVLRPLPLHADTYDLFTLNGTDTGQIPYTPISFALSFELPSTFLLSSVRPQGVYYDNIAVTLNGDTSFQDGVRVLYSDSGARGLVIPDLDGSSLIFVTYPFTTTDGTTASFTLENNLPVSFSNTPGNSEIPYLGNANLTISAAPVAATPEPSTLALVTTGFLGAVTVVHRRSIARRRWSRRAASV